ncbi:class I SAM-dependent methyltransferase [Arthrobacter sp. ISL-69]|uniref:class I SAM-dependent methyltransferase n=1 Tax=Arthrobacter sp. ISL-69 TaxID=2819113 RepID=UPI001BEAE53C|nr:methyltransferase domain-containing protein [Arthrobacter sp. ISL-69]MBT2534914.1 methyltransferase domain-containing protein [Arthrobacter sp. ISL-69]
MPTDSEQVRDQQRDTWDRFSAGWKKWDDDVVQWLAPFGEAMIGHAGLKPDSHVLDVAAGTGEPGLTAAAMVPAGSVTVTDLSEKMLMVAREKAAAAGLENVRTQVSEAAALPFDDGRFDAVLCRFGFMLFPDVDEAVREIARTAKPGGRIVAAVWGDPARNDWATTIMGIMNRHVQLPPQPPEAPGLFRCAAPGLMLKSFVDAGLTDVSEETLSVDMVQESPERFWEFMTDVAAAAVSGLAQADSGTRDLIRTQVLEAARTHERDGAIRLSSTATIVVGTV